MVKKMLFIVRIVGYVHFRGVLLEPRLCTSDGHLIGALRGGQFSAEEAWDEYGNFLFRGPFIIFPLGIDFLECGYHELKDAVTHKNDDKKFLVEANWKTEVDVGAVQFM